MLVAPESHADLVLGQSRLLEHDQRAVDEPAEAGQRLDEPVLIHVAP
jgi:hypothetical protein